jgi:hypothetical protein
MPRLREEHPRFGNRNRYHFLALTLAILMIAVYFRPSQARAQDHAYEIETGAVLICDTQKQVERYAQLFDGDQQAAIRSVNTEENNPNACVFVDISYVQGPDIGMARSRSHAFRIVPIVVVGVNTSRGYGSVAPALFFTPVKINELAV